MWLGPEEVETIWNAPQAIAVCHYDFFAVYLTFAPYSSFPLYQSFSLPFSDPVCKRNSTGMPAGPTGQGTQ